MPLTVLPTTTALIGGQQCDQSTLAPFRPFIFGPLAGLHRYTQTAEKAGINLGAYNSGSTNAYDWPSRAGTSVIDQSYAKLWFEKAYLNYFNDYVGIGSMITMATSYTNQVVSTADNFVSYINVAGTSYPRAATLYDRDVQIGDAVFLSAVVTSITYTLWTTVVGFVNNVIAPVIAATSADAGNHGAQSESASASQVVGTPANDIDMTADGSAYVSIADGYLTRTYTITVIQSSTGSDATTARLSVVSADGGDNQASVTPAAFTSATNIGTKGLAVTFAEAMDAGRQAAAVAAGISPDDLVVGQQWVVTVGQTWVVPTSTSNTAGTYTGSSDTKYIVTVTRGGQVPTVDAPATAATAGSASSGGALAANTYYAKYTYVNSNGETTGAPASSSFVTSSSNLTIALTLTDVTGLSNGATSINIYLGTASGGPYYLYKTGVTTSPASLAVALDTTKPLLPTSNTCNVSARAGIEPLVVVTTTTGVDTSGPTIVQAKNQAVVVGTQGITISFNKDLLAKGDIYYITATATRKGAIQTLVLANDLPLGMQPATDINLRLFIVQPLVSVPQVNPITSTVNWTTSPTYLTVKAGIQLTDPSWTNNGALIPVNVYQATMYGEYREWLVDLANTMMTFSDPATLIKALGPLDPDNPICYGVHKALENTPGMVLATGLTQSGTAANNIVCCITDGEPTGLDPTYQAWVDVLGVITGSDQVYNLVPLSSDPKVQALVQPHVDAQSDPSVGLRRGAIFSPTLSSVVSVVTSAVTSDGNTALATIAQDPGTLSTSFTYLRVPAGNALFVSNGVKPGDIVRYLYSADPSGNTIWTEFVVNTVVSNDALLLKTGPNAAVSTPQKMEIWRNLSKDSQVTALTTQAGNFADQRVQLVWPDSAVVAGVTVSGQYVCCALAGLYGAVPSHQSLTNVQLQGFDSVPRATPFFNEKQLETLDSNGVLVVSEAADGTIYIKNDVTTDISSTATEDSMVRRNTDMVAWTLLRAWSVYLGFCNNTSQTINAISNSFFTIVSALKRSNNIDRLGPPIYTAVINNLGQDPVLLDKVNADITISGPYPLNSIELTISI